MTTNMRWLGEDAPDVTDPNEPEIPEQAISPVVS